MPDPFPNELVEAAAKALRTSEIPITLSPTEGWVFDADESARAVLAAVLPLIERREEARFLSPDNPVCSSGGDGIEPNTSDNPEGNA